MKYKLKRDSLDGVTVAVQGVGHVGYHLCRELYAAGAKLTVADVDASKAERARLEFKATVVPNDSIFDVVADVLAPCALGSALNDETVPRLKVKIVAGAANNQLGEPRNGEMLAKRGIVYAPDYVINAGGLINVAQEVIGYDADIARGRTLEIYATILEIVQQAERDGIPSNRVADRMAEAILDRTGR